MRDISTKRQPLRSIHFGVMAITLSVLAAILTGCSLSLNNPDPNPQGGIEDERASSEGWVISQGEEPQVCEQEISRQEARQEAQEALKAEEEAKKLQQTLASLGKRLMVWRAQGCEVKTETEEDGNATSQGLVAMAEDETILVEVPAGADAALYLLEDESEEEGNYWASLKEGVPGGEKLTHIEVGLEGEAGVQGLSEGLGQVSFFLPDEGGTKEIAQQVQQLLQEGSGAGVSGMQVEGLDWENTEVVLLEDNTSEEQEAILVVPAQGASGQRLWGRGRPPIDEDQALFAKVRIKKLQSGYQVVQPIPQRPQLQPEVRKGAELKPAFQYCPFRYYGRLSPFRRVLCQDSWKHWYKKQWMTGDIYGRWAELYNQAAQLALPSGKAPSMFMRGLNILLYGFEKLDGISIQEMVMISKELLKGPPPALGSLPPLSYELRQALIELAQIVDKPDFEQRLEELKQKYPALANMLSLLSRITGWDEPSTAKALGQSAQQGDRSIELWIRYYRIAIELIARGIIRPAKPGEELPTACCSPQWRAAVLAALMTALLLPDITLPDGSVLRIIPLEQDLRLQVADGFLTTLERFLNGSNVAPGVDANKLIEDLLNMIPGPFLEIKELTVKAPPLEQVMDFVRLIQLVGNMIVYGGKQGINWQFIQFGREICIARAPVIGLCTAKGRIDLIATSEIPGLGQVTTFAKAYDKLNNIDRAAREIQGIIDFAAEHANDYPG